MRRFQWAAAAIALSCAACSKETPKAPPAPAETATSAPITETRPAPPAAPEAAMAATPPAPEPTPVAAPPAPPAPPPQRVMTIVPAKERRIHALLNNAISRDVTGHTEQDAGMWEARRAACKTQACVDRAYAAQETELRRWEGSEAIR